MEFPRVRCAAAIIAGPPPPSPLPSRAGPGQAARGADWFETALKTVLLFPLLSPLSLFFHRGATCYAALRKPPRLFLSHSFQTKRNYLCLCLAWPWQETTRSRN